MLLTAIQEIDDLKCILLANRLGAQYIYGNLVTYDISTVDRSRSKIRGRAAHSPIQLTTCFGPDCPNLIMSSKKNVGVN